MAQSSVPNVNDSAFITDRTAFDMMQLHNNLKALLGLKRCKKMEVVGLVASLLDTLSKDGEA